MPFSGRKNDKKPFSSGTSFETPTMLPFDPYAVIPPSTMTKFLAMIEFIDSALCIIHGASTGSLPTEGYVNTPSHARELKSGKTLKPRDNGFWILVSVLKTARRVKLFAFGTPFHGQSDVWRPTGEARERVARNRAIKARANMVVLSESWPCWLPVNSGNCKRQTQFYTLVREDDQTLKRGRVKLGHDEKSSPDSPHYSRKRSDPA